MLRFRRLFEENLADLYSSANSVGDVCPNSDSISPDPASILSSATETIVIALNSLTSHHREQASQSFICILEHHSYPGTNDRKECRVGLRSREVVETEICPLRGGPTGGSGYCLKIIAMHYFVSWLKNQDFLYRRNLFFFSTKS